MADGVWNTQINGTTNCFTIVQNFQFEIQIYVIRVVLSGFWVALSGDNLEAAFANYRFWESSGFAIGLILMRFTGIARFLHISLAMLLVGILAYLGVEFYDNIYVRFSISVNIVVNIFFS